MGRGPRSDDQIVYFVRDILWPYGASAPLKRFFHIETSKENSKR